MINKRSQPRLLRASEPEFGEVLAYMRKITAAQKIQTEYHVDGDTIISVPCAPATAAPAPVGAAHTTAGAAASAPRSPVLA
jgi:beta-galactosidase beta subunit